MRNISCDDGDLRGDIRVYYYIRGSRFKDNSHFPSCNVGETAGGDWIGGYRYQNSTLSPATHVTMVDCCIYLVLLAMLMIVFLKMKEFIVGVMVQDLEVCLKRSANINFTTPKEVLMIIVEVDTVLRTSPLPPIIHVIFVNHWVL